MPQAQDKKREIIPLINQRLKIEFNSFLSVSRILIDESREGKFSLSRLHILKESGDNVSVKVTLNGSTLLNDNVISENNIVKTFEFPGPSIQGLIELQIKLNAGAETALISSSMLELIE